MTENFDNRPLGILGWGFYFPQIQNVSELVQKAGGNSTNYLANGWPKIHVASGDEHPDEMSTQAIKQALEVADLQPNQLCLVISCGESQGYLGISTAMQVMKQIGTLASCAGFDLNQNCIAVPTALEIARNWLYANGGGYAAILSSERWVETIDRSDPNTEIFWGFSDGASALIVSTHASASPRASYLGSSFFSKPAHNPFLQRKFGGTRFPQPGVGELLSKRSEADISSDQMFAAYATGFESVIKSVKSRFGAQPTWLVCTQTSPGVVELLNYWTRIPSSKTGLTGSHHGHIGCSDVALGLDALFQKKILQGPGLVATSCPSGWSASLLVAPVADLEFENLSKKGS